MSLSRLFPRALAVCFALSLSSLNVAAQNAARPRAAGDAATTTTTTQTTDGRARLENDLFVVSTADESEVEPGGDFVRPAFGGLGSVERVMLEEIEERLGTPYRLGTEGPTRYDCSGFVWSVFNSAGISFERTSARAFWSQFEPAGEDEKYKFGTLVFFNGLRHVGIVADAEGFYHASTSRGVMYSRFGDYWSKRITGFRRVPLDGARTFVAAAGR
jgi:cell wall-associated NlpC family hydrolase